MEFLTSRVRLDIHEIVQIHFWFFGEVRQKNHADASGTWHVVFNEPGRATGGDVTAGHPGMTEFWPQQVGETTIHQYAGGCDL